MMNNVKIALVGNPNVGKSTVFNSLTGLHQHTGNWPGKTVSSSRGTFESHHHKYEIVDLPGTYSLISHSKEEEVTRDFICLEEYDLAIVVCDAVCLERNLNLALQVMDISPNTILVVNLIDEAEKKGIHIDFGKLSQLLDAPALGISARTGFNMENLLEMIYEKTLVKKEKNITLMCREHGKLDTEKYLKKAAEISHQVVTYRKKNYREKERKIDKILTNKITGIPIMIALLLFIFWLTISFSNIPSRWLFRLFAWMEKYLTFGLNQMHAPKFLMGILISRSISSADMGSCSNASAHGNLFSAFYFFRRFRISPSCCFQFRSCFSKVSCLWKAGPDNVYGIWM